MPFKKGNTLSVGKGAGIAVAKRNRLLSQAVRDEVPEHVLVRYAKAIMMARPGVRFAEDEAGELYVTWDDDGIPPTREEMNTMHKWLSDRGHGLPAQSIHLEAQLSATVTHEVAPTSALPATSQASILREIRNAKRVGAGAPAQANATALPPTLDGATLASVIDAVSTEARDDNDDDLDE